VVVNVLFIHDAFPAQFGQLALELVRQRGWHCRFLVQSLSSCPTPSAEMLKAVELHLVPKSAEHRTSDGIPWPQIYGHYLDQCQTIHDTLKAMPHVRPDLVVAHGGRGAPSLFLREVVNCPIIIYCEYYFATSHRDISYRIDLPPAEPAPFFPRCINAPTLATLVDCDAGYSATQWQKQSFPKRFHEKIEVYFDGIDAELYSPGPAARRIGERSIPAGTKVVTFASRGLESIRGFDLFMKVARRIAKARSDVIFVVAGGEEIHYGWDKLHTGAPSFKEWVLKGRGDDLDRFIFTGRILPEQLAAIFRLSDLHVYLTAPFVLSWSMLDAMASGCVVLASDVPPVREVIEPGRNGLIEPLFDVEGLTETALRVLDDPAAFAPLGKAARETIEQKYRLEVCIPPLGDYFERVASAGPSA
jgi:glycosyltransferase involved in cell wall biosynthesis